MNYEPRMSWFKTVAKEAAVLKLQCLILYYQLQHIFPIFRLYWNLIDTNFYKFEVYNMMTSHTVKWLLQGWLNIYHFI